MKEDKIIPGEGLLAYIKRMDEETQKRMLESKPLTWERIEELFNKPPESKVYVLGQEAYRLMNERFKEDYEKDNKL